MVENVDRLETSLKVPCLVVSEIELLQDTGVGGEAARIAQIGEEHRRVGERVVRGALERGSVQDAHAVLGKGSVDYQCVVVTHARLAEVSVGERPAQGSSRSLIASVDGGHLDRRALGAPSGDARQRPSAS